jgi:hypothetical protein
MNNRDRVCFFMKSSERFLGRSFSSISTAATLMPKVFVIALIFSRVAEMFYLHALSNWGIASSNTGYGTGRWQNTGDAVAIKRIKQPLVSCVRAEFALPLFVKLLRVFREPAHRIASSLSISGRFDAVEHRREEVGRSMRSEQEGPHPASVLKASCRLWPKAFCPRDRRQDAGKTLARRGKIYSVWFVLLHFSKVRAGRLYGYRANRTYVATEAVAFSTNIVLGGERYGSEVWHLECYLELRRPLPGRQLAG